MTLRTDPGVSGRHVGRYLLEDLVAENAGTALWRATDPALQRPVGARLVPLDDPRIPELRSAAQRAAGVHDRRLVRVLDVVSTDRHLAIVTEWVTGHSWSELLTDRWSSQEATIVALEVGRALESAHKAGVTHGRIRPDSVMITDTHEVRLRGLGVEAAVWGVSPPGDPRAADLHGIGCLLYAGLTRRWPLADKSEPPPANLPPAPTHNGSTELPSTVAPDVPAMLDEIVRRSLVTCHLPPGRWGFSGVSECVRALERAYSSVPVEEQQAEYAEGTDSATDRLVRRLSTLAVSLLAIAGLALLVWQLMANRVSQPEEGPPASSPVQQPGSGPTPASQERPFPIVSAKDFDPKGDDDESRGLVREAIDHNGETAWVTESYSSADLDGKGGVGLLLDLGAVRPVRGVTLKLVGSGTDFKILTAKQKPKRLSDLRTIVDVTGAPETIPVRLPTTRVAARFVLVWLTGLPFNGESYSGGLRGVRVVG